MKNKKKRCIEAYREEKRKVKMSLYISKKKLNEQCGRKMHEDVNRNRNLFWKEVSNAKGGKVEICSRINDGNGRLAHGEDQVRRIWKEYFEEQVAVHMRGFDGIRRGNYFGGEPIERAEVEVRVSKLKNGKATCKDEIKRERIKGGGDRVMD